MRYCDSALGGGIGAEAAALGLVTVRPIFSGGSSFAFRPYNYQYGYNYPYQQYQQYQYYQPAYQYADNSCPVAIALTPQQTAAVRAGQVVTVSARNNCGQVVQVTVQGSPA